MHRKGGMGRRRTRFLPIAGDDQRFGPVEDAARLIRSAPTKVKAPEALPAFDNALSFVYLYVGAPDRVLDYQERVIAEGNVLFSQQVRYLWSPDFAPVRKTERFKLLCGRPSTSITGARAAGPTTAAPWAPTTSSAIDALKAPRKRPLLAQ